MPLLWDLSLCQYQVGVLLRGRHGAGLSTALSLPESFWSRSAASWALELQGSLSGMLRACLSASRAGCGDGGDLRGDAAPCSHGVACPFALHGALVCRCCRYPGHRREQGSAGPRQAQGVLEPPFSLQSCASAWPVPLEHTWLVQVPLGGHRGRGNLGSRGVKVTCCQLPVPPATSHLVCIQPPPSAWFPCPCLRRADTTHGARPRLLTAQVR